MKIVAHTQSTIEVDGNQLTLPQFIVYVARVSNPENQSNVLTYSKLLNYLIKNKHFSPLEMASIQMEIKTTRDISRQILRHDMNFQEASQRYSDPRELGFVIRETRLQDPKNRQNSLENIDTDLDRMWRKDQENVLRLARKVYGKYKDLGLAKEQLRAILPEGLTMTTLYISANMRSWLHYCQLRMTDGTQKEHRDIATKAWDAITTMYPDFKNIQMG